MNLKVGLTRAALIVSILPLLSLPSLSAAQGNSQPTISGSPRTNAAIWQGYYFAPMANDADGDRLTFSVTNLPHWARFEPTTGQIWGTPRAGDQGYYTNILIKADDGKRPNWLAPFTIRVGSVSSPQAASANQQPRSSNSQPSLSGTPSKNATAGQGYYFAPRASDADGDRLTFSVTNLPHWARFEPTTGQIWGTPRAGDQGYYTNILIKVDDGKQPNWLAPFTIRVGIASSPQASSANQQIAGSAKVTLNSAPTISGTPRSSSSVGQHYYFGPVARDVNGDRLNFSVNNLPRWATFESTTGQMWGTPSASDAGSHNNIVISVSDGARRAYLPAFSIWVASSGQSNSGPGGGGSSGSGSSGGSGGAPTAAGSATLTWNPPTRNDDGSSLTDLAGYVVQWGTSPRNYTRSATISNAGLTSFVVGNLASGTTYYFAIKAVNQRGRQSSFSNEASRRIP